jgi:hypothetical protein
MQTVSGFSLQFLSLPSVVAPLKYSLLLLSGSAEFQPFSRLLCEFQSKTE